MGAGSVGNFVKGLPFRLGTLLHSALISAYCIPGPLCERGQFLVMHAGKLTKAAKAFSRKSRRSRFEGTPCPVSVQEVH